MEISQYLYKSTCRSTLYTKGPAAYNHFPASKIWGTRWRKSRFKWSLFRLDPPVLGDMLRDVFQLHQYNVYIYIYYYILYIYTLDIYTLYICINLRVESLITKVISLLLSTLSHPVASQTPNDCLSNMDADSFTHGYDCWVGKCRKHTVWWGKPLAQLLAWIQKAAGTVLHWDANMKSHDTRVFHISNA